MEGDRPLVEESRREADEDARHQAEAPALPEGGAPGADVDSRDEGTWTQVDGEISLRIPRSEPASQQERRIPGKPFSSADDLGSRWGEFATLGRGAPAAPPGLRAPPVPQSSGMGDWLTPESRAREAAMSTWPSPCEAPVSTVALYLIHI